MKIQLLAAAFFLFPSFVSSTFAEDDAYNSVEQLKSDLNQAAVVELIRPSTVILDKSVSGFYHVYRTDARVVESFKGNAKSGDAVTFFSDWEEKPADSFTNSERIVFLEKDKEEKTGKKILMEMENSSRAPSKSAIQKLRKLRRSAYNPPR